MELKIYKQNVIQNLSSWLKYAEPEGGEKQWQEGRSAMEFARYMMHRKNELPKEIEEYLTSIGINGTKYTCQPEYITSYDGYGLGRGSGRHHDALLMTTNAVIGIEAKVSESFDASVKEKLEGAKKNSDKGTNMMLRIMESIKLITGIDYNRRMSEVEHLMYQLISATIGTLIEAHKAKVPNTIVLVIEFVGDIKEEKDYDKKIKENETAFEDFLLFLKIKGKDDNQRRISVNVKGNDINVWFKKMTISIAKPDLRYTSK